MEFRRVRMLAAVAELESIGRAARELHLPQPALSRQVRALEDEVGAPLLVRSARGVIPTAAGAAMLARIRGLDARIAQAMGRARLAAAGRTGRVRFGLGRFALDDPQVSTALAALQRAEPDIEVVINEVGTPLHTRALLHEEVDLTIGVEESPHNARLDRRTLRVERISCAIIPASHPLARSRALVARDLRDLPLLMPGRSVGWVFPPVRRALADMGLPVGVECETLETAYALVAAGRGWVAGAATSLDRAPSGAVAIPLRGLDVEIPLTLRWRKGASSPLIQRLVRLLTRAFRGDEETPPRASVPAIDAAPAARVLGELEARHLRAFVTVTNEGSLADAARRLELTKSAVSRQVSALERIVGAQLLARRGGLLLLTPAGRMLRDQAVAALETLDGAVVAAQLAARGIARRCTLAMTPTPLAEATVRSLLRRAPRELPAVAVEVRELGATHALEALQRGEVDVALILQPEALPLEPGVVSRALGSEPIDTVLVSARGPLGARAALVPGDLAALPFLYFPRGANARLHEYILAELERAGIAPRPGKTFDGPRAIWRFVAEGQGWSIGVQSLRAAPPPGVVALPMIGLSIASDLCVVSRREERDPHVRALVAALGARDPSPTPAR